MQTNYKMLATNIARKETRARKKATKKGMKLMSRLKDYLKLRKGKESKYLEENLAQRKQARKLQESQLQRRKKPGNEMERMPATKEAKRQARKCRKTGKKVRKETGKLQDSMQVILKSACKTEGNEANQQNASVYANGKEESKEAR